MKTKTRIQNANIIGKNHVRANSGVFFFLFNLVISHCPKEINQNQQNYSSSNPPTNRVTSLSERYILIRSVGV
tara:strand:- start:1575 stop:1793 length:219 start_codon:yes stop_codon:yes gene_type:complete